MKYKVMNYWSSHVPKEGSVLQLFKSNLPTLLKIYLTWQNEVVKNHISTYLYHTLFTVYRE